MAAIFFRTCILFVVLGSVRSYRLLHARAVRADSIALGAHRLATAARMEIKVGDRVIANNDWNSSSPSYGIVRAQLYELRRVYYQGMVEGRVARVDVSSLEAEVPPSCAGFTKYIALFSERYHGETGPVVVRPNEVQVISLWDEVADSAWLALPGLFWVWLAFTIFKYGESHGFVL